MIAAMIRKAATALILLALAGSPAAAQEVTAVLDRDIRLFVFSAALNVAGFDAELGPAYHPVRQLVRERLGGLDPDLVGRLRAFYQEHRGVGPEVDHLAPYISLALSVGAPPAMTPLYSEELMPPDAREVAGFLPLVREFYLEANLTGLWRSVAPGYEAGLDRLAAPVRDLLLGSEAYLRVPSGTGGQRQAVILLELTSPINSVNIRNYPDNLYIVLGDAGSVPLDVIRHGYLHLMLDPLLAAYRDDLAPTSDLLTLIEGVEGIRDAYTADYETMAVESLIRAIELGMDRAGTDDTGEVDRAYRAGLLLTPFFYGWLDEFEAGDAGMRQYFGDMVEALDPDAERERFEARFFSIAAGEAAPARAESSGAVRTDPVREALVAAQAAFNSGDTETARVHFLRVLEEIDPGNGAALYGMALIASRDQDSELARHYFSETISSDTADSAMVVWSHIYLGRIEDLRCGRDAALGHYRRALESGDDSGGARDAAREGIETPFGGNC